MTLGKDITLAMLVGVLAFPLTVLAADGGSDRFVAGSAPYRRPANAPVVKTFAASAEWRKAALIGVTEPLPASLKVLDSQGAWYTPFDQPGMPGYYDLRGMHAVPTASKR